MFIIKYDPGGNIQWQYRFNGPADTYQSPESIAIDKNGFPLIVGNELKYNATTFTYDSKLLILKLRKNGKRAWIKKDKSLIGSAISSDNNGNVLVAGAFNIQNIYMLQKLMVTKYSSEGDSLWTSVFNEINKNGRAYFVGADAAGNIYSNTWNH